MPKVKRLRVFGGPNGSGKSTLFQEFSGKYNTGYFINADLLEQRLQNGGTVPLNELNISADQAMLDAFLSKGSSKSMLEKSAGAGHEIKFSIKDNEIVINSENTLSYEASLIAAFIRELLFINSLSFCFETVMSHPSKLAEIEEANEQGYQTYLYFVCTDTPEINVSRVSNRVEKGGHNVSDTKIKERYYRALENLFPAINLCYRSFLFDNSGDKITLIAEIYKANELKLHIDSDFFPEWFKEYVLKYYL